MTLRYLLDTSTLSWVIAPRPNRAVVQRLSAYAARCAIAAPVWHELRYGCTKMRPGRRRAELEAFLRDVVLPALPILSYDQAAAEWHSAERARLEQAGRPVPFVDGQIAAIAHIGKLVLVTANPRDFAPFRDLEVEDWTRL